jgi:two-component system cell cycle response regulator
MTALVLVVDDLAPNVKLLETKLTSEYYNVITAGNGFEAISVAKAQRPDIILLDVMMPEMDGFEACQKLKSDPETAHIPVIMVTALSEPSDRVRGLQAGADDFLTKPINDTALFARLKSLVRLKIMVDELRLRGQSSLQMGVAGGGNISVETHGCKVLMIDDDTVQSRQTGERLITEGYQFAACDEPERAVTTAVEGDYDLVIVSTQLFDADGLRLCSQLRGHEATRHVPLLILVDEDDQALLLKGLELGVNDYLITPMDFNEMVARVRTQLRRKRYQDALKSSYVQTLSLATTDNLTGLYNRHYMGTHLQNMAASSQSAYRPLSLMIMDIDHFKSVNDTYGHAIGDMVLKEVAKTIIDCIRGSDLAVRYGGEEFVVVMPNTSLEQGIDVAERIRRVLEEKSLPIPHPDGSIRRTVSVGVAELQDGGDTIDALICRADDLLYQAKHGGRNRVVASASA